MKNYCDYNIKSYSLNDISGDVREYMTDTSNTELVMKGHLSVEGTLKANKFITADGKILSMSEVKESVDNKPKPMKIQGVEGGVLVHERVIWGMGNQAPKSYGTSDTFICQVYGPFTYAVPAKNPDTTRKYRIYAIYSDGMTKSGKHTITFNVGSWGNSDIKASFNLPRTWGTTSAAPTEWNRDAYSNFINEDVVKGASHGKIYAKVKGEGTQTGVLRYLVLQSWDFPN